ncbi:putative RNA-directed DNA polymerase [Helianthus annuus]|nr:putative RNA-directed DNA polymerase [Helianthus annuus]
MSGGLIWMWDPNIFKVEDIIQNRSFLTVRGTLVGSGAQLNLMNVYAPQSVVAKRQLWEEISSQIESLEGKWVLAGDFNAVRSMDERKRSKFKAVCAENFNKLIFENGLLEFPMQGRKFTCIRDNGRKLSKLDRFLVCSDFFNGWPHACVRVLPGRHSDHCPIILEVVDLKFGPRPFRVFSSWIGQPGFEEAVVEASESFEVLDPPDVSLTSKFAHIRTRLKVWRDEFLAKEKESVNLALEELEALEKEMENRDLTEDEEWTLAENRKIVKESDYRKNLDLKQRSRVRWALDGDENSKFFHALINNRKASNSIHGLNVNGDWCSKPAQIKKQVFSFFREKFREKHHIRPKLDCSNIKKISDSESNVLIEPFLEQEIKEAVFECGDEKAPGPDGMNFRFIKHFWSLFKDDFRRIFDWFYNSGEINLGSGASFIALVPKVKDPVSLANYRPINLVGVISKVISKVLANRLRRVLDGVISENQSAFLKGRYILDGPLIVNEIISWIKKKKDKAFILKIDFDKAYDNVNWNFLVSIFQEMGFHEKWCSWIMGILKSASSSVLVNGSPTFTFRCEKGLRQGDPLSPFLFLVVMEALSVILVNAKNEGILKGISIPNNGPNISHLLYADDAIVMGEWSRSEIVNVVRTLRCFFICSGLKINIEKSYLFGIGVGSGEIEEMANLLGCKHDSPPFKFLGLKVGANMNRISNWQPVIESFRARLAKWKSHLLSIGGRVVLIKSVMESLPTYYFSLYKAPKKIISDLEAMIKKFLWGGSGEVKKIHWVAWEKVSCQKKFGGLGLSKLEVTNKSLLAKWGWRFKTEENKLWKKVIVALHSSRSGWECIPYKKTLSGVWNNIAKNFVKTKVEGRPLGFFMKGIIGNGEGVAFWHDVWLLDEPLKLAFPELYNIEAEKRTSVANRINAQNSEDRYSWSWVNDILEPAVTTKLVQLEALLNNVQFTSGIDRWKWSSAEDGSFSVKSVKQLLIGNQLQGDTFVMDWCAWVPAKVNIHSWRLELDKVATAEALRRRNVDINDTGCPLCHSDEETVDHLFIACFISSIVWNGISNWCCIPNIYAFSIRDLLTYHIDSGLSEKKKEAIYGIIMITCWVIWRTRNKVKFSLGSVCINSIISEIKALSYFWFSNRSKYKGLEWRDWNSFVNM